MILEYWVPRGVALTLYYPAYDGEWSSQYVTSPAGLDSEASIDKAAFTDCTNEWTEIGSSGVGYLDLTAGEMDNGEIVVQTKSSTAGVNFPLVVIHTYTEINTNVVNWKGSAAPAMTGDAYAVVSNGTYGNSALKDLSTAIKGKTDNLPASPAAVGSAMTLHADYDAAKTAASVTDIFSYAVEGSLTFLHYARLTLARLVGKANGGGTDTINFRDQADSKNRITMTVDSNGNRSAVTKDGT